MQAPQATYSIASHAGMVFLALCVLAVAFMVWVFICLIVEGRKKCLTPQIGLLLHKTRGELIEWQEVGRQEAFVVETGRITSLLGRASEADGKIVSIKAAASRPKWSTGGVRRGAS